MKSRVSTTLVEKFAFRSVSVQVRRMTIVFAEDQKLCFTIPTQRELATERASLFGKLFSADKLSLEVDGTLFVIPWNSVKYITVDPLKDDDIQPSHILKGLSMAD